jgi:hypothetical protein
MNVRLGRDKPRDFLGVDRSQAACFEAFDLVKEIGRTYAPEPPAVGRPRTADPIFE